MSDEPGPRTLTAQALLGRAAGGRRSVRGVATSELAKLLVRIEQEAAAPYRAELGWALDLLDQYEAHLLEHGDDPMEVYSADHLSRKSAIRAMLDQV